MKCPFENAWRLWNDLEESSRVLFQGKFPMAAWTDEHFYIGPLEYISIQKHELCRNNHFIQGISILAGPIFKSE
jgi:hypothetical protein